MTPIQKMRFLELLTRMSIRMACTNTGIAEETMYRERAKNSYFDMQCRAVIDGKARRGAPRTPLTPDEISARRADGIHKALAKAKEREVRSPKAFSMNGCVLMRRASGRCSGVLTCAHYERCLDEAARYGWDGWKAKSA